MSLVMSDSSLRNTVEYGFQENKTINDKLKYFNDLLKQQQEIREEAQRNFFTNGSILIDFKNKLVDISQESSEFIAEIDKRTKELQDHLNQLPDFNDYQRKMATIRKQIDFLSKLSRINAVFEMLQKEDLELEFGKINKLLPPIYELINKDNRADTWYSKKILLLFDKALPPMVLPAYKMLNNVTNEKEILNGIDAAIFLMDEYYDREHKYKLVENKIDFLKILFENYKQFTVNTYETPTDDHFSCVSLIINLFSCIKNRLNGNEDKALLKEIYELEIFIRTKSNDFLATQKLSAYSDDFNIFSDFLYLNISDIYFIKNMEEFLNSIILADFNLKNTKAKYESFLTCYQDRVMKQKNNNELIRLQVKIINNICQHLMRLPLRSQEASIFLLLLPIKMIELNTNNEKLFTNLQSLSYQCVQTLWQIELFTSILKEDKGNVDISTQYDKVKKIFAKEVNYLQIIDKSIINNTMKQLCKNFASTYINKQVKCILTKVEYDASVKILTSIYDYIKNAHNDTSETNQKEIIEINQEFHAAISIMHERIS